MLLRPAHLAWPLAFLAATASSQTPQSSHPPVIRTSATRFVAAAGKTAPGVRVVRDPATGNPEFVYGGRIVLENPPRSPAAYASASRVIVDRYPEMFGLPANELVLDEVKFLELSRIGSSDKVVALFHQVVDGIPVLESTLSFLFEARTGDLLALDTQGVPGANAVARDAQSSGSDAIAAASAAFAKTFGAAPTEVIGIDAVIVGPSARFDASSGLPLRGPALAYRIVLANPQVMHDNAPAEAEVVVSAEGDLTVFRIEQVSHAAIGGSVSGKVNIGPEPNQAANMETPFLEYVNIKDAGTNAVVATSDANGSYSIASDAPFAGYAELSGPYAIVFNKQGANSRIDVPFAGPGTFPLVFNPTLAEFPTAEVAAFFWANKFRDWIKSVDPNEVKMDFPVKANVNLASTCNAYFSGNSVNFFASGGGCTNTSYRAVCHHEEGHFANERFNGAVSGAFHEGVADAWAYFISDDPCLQAFSFSGGCLRHGEQTSVLKCPKDGDESCHGGEPHNEGQAIASALWAVRKSLKTTYGATPGSTIANDLFLSWFQTYDDRKILNVINDHWIALDDDNGSLLDLTPHFAAINAGFHSYNWPTFVVPDLTIDLVTGPDANGSVAPNQPVAITADFGSYLGTVVTRELRYSLDNGANYTTLAMAPTATANRYTATIPAQPLGKRVRWYLRSVGTYNGNSLTFPKNAPGDANVYASGYFYELSTYDFEGISDGFTHVSLTGAAGTDEWVRANPVSPGSAEATDPKFAYSGNFIYGTDLSTTLGADGKYEPSSSSELVSPVLDFTGSSSVILQFRRQLAVDKFTSDQATVRVNGTIVWQNPSNASTIDANWTLQEIDISALAANNPSVQVSWRVLANGSTEYGGWNVDDVVFYRVDAPYAGYFETYGEGCVGTWEAPPTLTGKGPPSPGQTITLKMTNGIPFNQVFLFVGTAQGNAPLAGDCKFYLGGILLVPGLPIIVGLDGKQTLPVTIPNTAGTGDAYLQFIATDPGSSNKHYTASNGLHIHIQ